MTTTAIDALHDLRTATTDVPDGYLEMSARAKPDIKLVIRRLSETHEQHAAERAAALGSLREPKKDDSSLQGTSNKFVVILRDGLPQLDREVMPAVRGSEKSIGKEHDKALQNSWVSEIASVAVLLKKQRRSIGSEIERLPQS